MNKQISQLRYEIDQGNERFNTQNIEMKTLKSELADMKSKNEES